MSRCASILRVWHPKTIQPPGSKSSFLKWVGFAKKCQMAPMVEAASRRLPVLKPRPGIGDNVHYSFAGVLWRLAS